MPIYEYKCSKCGKQFELRLGILHNKSSIKCPVCGSEDPERIFSPFMTTGYSSGSSCSSNSGSRFS